MDFDGPFTSLRYPSSSQFIPNSCLCCSTILEETDLGWVKNLTVQEQGLRLSSPFCLLGFSQYHGKVEQPGACETFEGTSAASFGAMPRCSACTWIPVVLAVIFSLPLLMSQASQVL